MNTIKKVGTIRKHPLIELLRNNKGNPRTLILMEPLWGIPYNLIAPFTTLYMYTQGITDVLIGLILSIAMFVQVGFSFFGGIITDKLGRKFTTMLGDFFGWCVACLVWAISDSFWLFLIAVLFNSFEQINQTAWFCLLIEDAEPKDLLGVYTWVNIGGLVAIFFAPISGLLVSSYTVIPVIRVLYLIFAVNMLIKVIITYKYCSETRQGKIRMAETKNTSVSKMLYEYKDLIPKVLKNKEIVKVLSVCVILHITNLVSTSFFSLYVTTKIRHSRSIFSFFSYFECRCYVIFYDCNTASLRFCEIPHTDVDWSCALCRVLDSSDTDTEEKCIVDYSLCYCCCSSQCSCSASQRCLASVKYKSRGAGSYKCFDYVFYHCICISLWLFSRMVIKH